MTAREKLLSLTSLSGCRTAWEHFCSVVLNPSVSLGGTIFIGEELTVVSDAFQESYVTLDQIQESHVVNIDPETGPFVFSEETPDDSFVVVEQVIETNVILEKCPQ